MILVGRDITFISHSSWRRWTPLLRGTLQAESVPSAAIEPENKCWRGKILQSGQATVLKTDRRRLE